MCLENFRQPVAGQGVRTRLRVAFGIEIYKEIPIEVVRSRSGKTMSNRANKCVIVRDKSRRTSRRAAPTPPPFEFIRN